MKKFAHRAVGAHLPNDRAEPDRITLGRSRTWGEGAEGVLLFFRAFQRVEDVRGSWPRLILAVFLTVALPCDANADDSEPSHDIVRRLLPELVPGVHVARDVILLIVHAGDVRVRFEIVKKMAESVTVTVSSQFPMVSAVAMIAPSPDWFAGAADVNLMEGGQWVSSRSVDLSAWDSGGDDGTTYKASDKDNNPKKPTTMASTPHFVINGNRPPVGRLVFTKM